MIESADKERQFSALMVRSICDDDRAAYARLLTEVTPLLRRAVWRRRRVLQPQDVEDLVQDILLSLHRVRATFDPRRPFLPWLMAIVRNRMADSARHYARHAAHEIAVEKLPETFAADSANMPDDAYADPGALRRAIQRLPRGQRAAIEILKLKELSLKEASAITGMSVGALKVAVHRAIKALRTTLRREA